MTHQWDTQWGCRLHLRIPEPLSDSERGRDCECPECYTISETAVCGRAAIDRFNLFAALTEIINKTNKRVARCYGRTVRTREKIADKENNCVVQELKLKMSGKFTGSGVLGSHVMERVFSLTV